MTSWTMRRRQPGVAAAILGVAALVAWMCGCATPPRGPNGLLNGGAVDAARAIYHCGALDRAGVDWLLAHGVTNVIKLDSWAEDDGDQYAVRRGLTVQGFPLSGWQQMTGSGVSKMLPLALRAIKPGTVIHCRQGRNRTMTLCGIYWVADMGWSMDRAEQEMLAYGWGDSFPGLKNTFYGRRGW